MKTSRWFAVILGLIFASFLLSLIFYPFLPDTMVSHWNLNGVPDGYSSKWFSFAIPVLSVFVVTTFWLLPKIDPLGKNVLKFINYYYGFVCVFLFFFLLINLEVLLWNVGITFNLNIVTPILVAGLFYYLSILFEKSKRNWFIGFRTPWTLSSDKVWNKTHKQVSNVFKVLSALMLLSILSSKFAFFIVLTVLMFVIPFVFIYSFLEYKKLKKE